MVTQPLLITFEEYLEKEAASEEKHEWLAGIVYAMSRGSPEHARLSANVVAVLRAALKGECAVYSSDVMLFVAETSLSTYADATVTCGAVETYRVMKNGRSLGEAITNPVLLVEVLSDSTQAYDRGEKFAHYMRVASLEEYVLVSQTEPRVEIFRRVPGGGHWAHEIAAAGETVTLHGQSIAVDDIYAK